MGSKRDIWIPIYIADFIADTSHLDAARSGCYLLWMMHYWRRGPLSGDLADLAAIGRLRGNDAPSIAQALLDEFFTLESDGLWHQKRLNLEIIKWQRKSLTNKERASKAARKRWENHQSKNAPSIAPSIASSNATEMLERCQSPTTMHSSSGSFSPSLRSVEEGLIPPPPSGERPPGEPVALADLPVSQAENPDSRNGTQGGLEELRYARGQITSIEVGKVAKKKIAPRVGNDIQPSKRPHEEKLEKDSRHTLFKEEIFTYWSSQNPTLGRCPWSGAEAGALGDLLAASPDLAIDLFKEMLRHRSQSDVNWSDRPCKWLRNLTMYANGPLDRFNKLMPAPRRF